MCQDGYLQYLRLWQKEKQFIFLKIKRKIEYENFNSSKSANFNLNNECFQIGLNMRLSKNRSCLIMLDTVRALQY